MREAIGGTWLLGLVLTFIVFFASFLAVSINYSKAFNVKNNIVDLISKYEGNNCNARNKIEDYLYGVGYLVMGTCPENYYAYGLQGNYLGESVSGNGVKGYYCVASEETSNTVIKKQYYRVVTFFRLDLPMVGDLTTFRIKGETEAIYFPTDSSEEKKTNC